MPRAQLRAAPNTAAPRSKRLRGSESDALRKIRALYMVVYNDEQSLIPLAIELFHAVGAILEGTPMRHIDLRLINKDAVLRELKDTGVEQS